MASPTQSKPRIHVKAALEETQCEALHHQNAVEEIRKCVFIKLPKVKALTTLSASEIYRRIAAGTFPKQVVLGPKSVVWIESEVLAWREVCVSESREEVV